MTEPRDAVDRLLKAELRATGDALPAATPACVDAETFAAWVEGALPVTQSNALESHAADCARCQAMMAAFAQTETAAAAAAAPTTARPDWLFRWLMPAAAGAAAITLAVWLTRSGSPTTPDTPAPSAPSQQMAQGTAKQQPKLEAAPPAQAPAQGRLADKAAGARDEDRARNQVANDKKEKDRIDRFKEDASKRAAEQNTLRQNETKVTRADAQPVSAAVPPPTPVASPTAPPPATISGLPQSALSVTLPPPPPPATSTAAAASATTSPATQTSVFRNSTLDGVAPAGVLVEFSSSATQIQGAAGGAGGGRGGAGRGGAVDVSSSVLPSRQWRIYSSGVVEQSNNGTSWTRVTLDPQVRVTTGSAPSLNVCWLAGRDGAVLISLNADHFNKVPFPEAVDLTSIRATNAREATVTTADGRTFVTTDAGLTWTIRQ